jgi:hypothetical protein
MKKKWTAIGLNKTIQKIKLKGEKAEISYEDCTIYTHLYNNWSIQWEEFKKIDLPK